MEKFFDRISLVISGIGIAFSYAHFLASEYITCGILGVVSLVLLYAGFTGGKK